MFSTALVLVPCSELKKNSNKYSNIRPLEYACPLIGVIFFGSDSILRTYVIYSPLAALQSDCSSLQSFYIRWKCEWPWMRLQQQQQPSLGHKRLRCGFLPAYSKQRIMKKYKVVQSGLCSEQLVYYIFLLMWPSILQFALQSYLHFYSTIKKVVGSR